MGLAEQIQEEMSRDLSNLKISKMYLFRSDTGEAILVYDAKVEQRKRLYNTELIGGL